MKNILRFTLMLLVTSLGFVAPLGWAQDPVELAPDIYKVLLENDRVRVADILFKPGDKIAIHSHPDHLLYILSPGKIKLSYEDGSAKEVDAKAGDTLWIPAESHASENVGATEFHALIVELKQ